MPDFNHLIYSTKSFYPFLVDTASKPDCTCQFTILRRNEKRDSISLFFSFYSHAFQIVESWTHAHTLITVIGPEKGFGIGPSRMGVSISLILPRNSSYFGNASALQKQHATSSATSMLEIAATAPRRFCKSFY